MTARTARAMKPPSRRFSGFAVTTGADGPLIWGTLRPAQADAWAAYISKNPAVDGFPPSGQLVAVSLTIQPIEPE